MTAKVIAECALKVEAEDESTFVIHIAIKQPSQNRDWKCIVEVTSPEEEFSHEIFGANSYQALKLAVDFAELRIKMFRKAYGDKIDFFGKDNAD